MEVRAQQIDFSRKILGLLFGFLLALIMMVSSMHIILLGYSAEELIGIGGTVVAIVGAFVYTDSQKRNVRRHRQAPQDQLTPAVVTDSDLESG